MINVTEVKIYPFDTGEPESNLRAYAQVTLDNCLTLRGIKVLQTETGGLFIGFPARKRKDGKFQDLIQATPEFKSKLRDKTLNAYKEYI